MHFSNYEEVLDFLYNNLPMFQRQGASAFRKDLSKTYQLDDMLEHPHKNYKTIHIAGTNGKGSTAHMLASVLQESRLKVGLYTSPHLKDFTERIKINGKQITKTAVSSFVNEHIERIMEIKPSFFEITVAMAFQYFKDQEVDVAVIETGMGGRLDSTNIIEPVLSVITNVSFDHMQYLGNTLPEIAGEKAGIIKKHIPVVISEQQEEIAGVFEERAALEHAQIYFATETYQVEYDNSNILIRKEGRKIPLQIQLPFMGSYQKYNLAGVLKSVDILRQHGFEISDEHLESGLRNTFVNTGLKGRYQIIKVHPRVIADVAHNEAGLRLVMEQVMKETFRKLYIILAVVNDKDLSKIWPILPKEAYYFFSQADIPRALPAAQLAEEAQRNGFKGEVVTNIPLAYERALDEAGEDDLIYIGGSTFTVAEIKDL